MPDADTLAFVTTTGAWIEELAGLDHRARVARAVALGRAAAAGDALARDHLAELRQSEDVYARSMALWASFGGTHAQGVIAALSDPSRALRRRAAKRVAASCDDVQAEQVLLALPRGRQRTALCAQLARAQRHVPVQALLSRELNEAAPDGRTLDLFAFASSTFVRAHFARVVGALGADGLRRMAQWHAPAVTAHMAAEIDQRGLADFRLRHQLASVLTPLCERAPKAALALVATLLGAGEEPKHWLSGALRELLRHEPQATFDVLRKLHQTARPVPPPGAFGAVRFDKVAHRLGEERLGYLIEHGYATLSDGDKARRWFLRLSPTERSLVVDVFVAKGRGHWGGFLFRHIAPDGPRQKERERAYRRWSAAAQDQHGVIAHHLLAALPDDLRQREARRHLDDVAWLEARATERMRYARYLRFEPAKQALAPWLGHSEGDVRADALRTLLSVPRFHPVDTPLAITAVLERKFDQDPVRFAMLDTLSQLPLRCFTAALTEPLGRAWQDALDAADLSAPTSLAIERLLVRLFRLDPSWGATWLAKLLRLRGSLSSAGLAAGLLPEQTRALSPAIADLAAQWANKERAGALLWLATALGQRLRLIDPLLGALEQLSTELPLAFVAGQALSLLRSHAPARFAELVPRLLDADPSFVFLPSVAFHLSTRRQDLLDRFLQSEPMQGRFASGRTHWLVFFEAGFGTWTGPQQTQHAAALTAVLHDDERDVPTLRACISTLAQLSFAPRDALLPFASDPRPPVREMVIRALPRLDADVALPVLIECLADDRARFAIYALRKVLSEMAPHDVVARLTTVSMKKVTVAKEVIRLLGDLGGPDGYAALLAYDRAALHRDVRIALLRALWDHLHREASWAVFEEALADPDWVVASRITDIPLGRLDETQEQRVTELVVRLLARPEPEARLALLQRAAYLPLRDTQRVLFRACLARIRTGKDNEATHALSAVLRRMVRAETDAVVVALSELFADRRRLHALLPILPGHMGPYAAKHVSAVGAQLVQKMAADPLLAPQRLELAGHLLGYRALGDLLVELAAQHLLHFDTMSAAVHAIGRCTHPVQLEAQLGQHTDARLRRLGLEALRRASGSKRGWSKERQQRLAHYQADHDPLVASAAAFVFPPARRKRAVNPSSES